jgi:bifunctional DNA-binding transcriptional regulator/antitoxin component of YhaV-PrlF toxin-antitoxin module
MTSLNVSHDGSITLPKDLAEKAGFKAHMPLDVIETGGKIVLSPVKNMSLRFKLFGDKLMTLDELAGSLKSPFDRPVTLEEMEEGAIAGAIERYKRSYEHD